MSRSTGQIVRLVGLALEVVGLLAQVLRTKTDQAGVPLPGHFSSHQVWMVVGAGFVIWMIGTILIYASQTLRSKPAARDEIGELRL